MSIAITEDHRALAETVRSFADKRNLRGAARERLESSGDVLPEFWAELAELGWLGLHLPEDVGGSGYGIDELVVVVEELARAVAPGPFVPTVIASAVIAAAGDDELKSRVLPGLADGSTVGAVALGGSVTVSDGAASGDAGVVLGAGARVAHPRAGRRRRGRRRHDRRRRDDRLAAQPRPHPAQRPGDARRRAGHGDGGGPSRARRSGPGDPVGRRGRRRPRVHGDGRRLLQGAHPVRPPDRDVPGGEAPLRQHGRRHRTRHQRRVGRCPRRRPPAATSSPTRPRRPPRWRRPPPTCAPT